MDVPILSPYRKSGSITYLWNRSELDVTSRSGLGYKLIVNMNQMNCCSMSQSERPFVHTEKATKINDKSDLFKSSMFR